MDRKERKQEKKYAKQRAEKGFCDRDTWDISFWFINTCRNILKEYAETMHGFPANLELEWLEEHPEVGLTYNEWVIWPHDENSEGYKLREKANEECAKKWEDTIKHLVWLLDEMDEETCSMTNPYEEKWWSFHEKFDKKYSNSKDELKTEKELLDEKRTNTFLHIGPERDPDFGEEYKEVLEKFLEAEKRISHYRDECKNEFFELFSKWFWNLWD